MIPLAIAGRKSVYMLISWHKKDLLVSQLIWIYIVFKRQYVIRPEWWKKGYFFLSFRFAKHMYDVHGQKDWHDAEPKQHLP